MQVGRTKKDVAQGGNIESVLELHYAGSDRRAAASRTWQADVMEAVVRHTPSGVAHRAVGFSVEEYEAPLRSGRHRLLIALHPIVEWGVVRYHGALIRSDSRRKRIE